VEKNSPPIFVRREKKEDKKGGREDRGQATKNSPQISHRGLWPQPKLQIAKYKLQTNYN